MNSAKTSWWLLLACGLLVGGFAAPVWSQDQPAAEKTSNNSADEAAAPSPGAPAVSDELATEQERLAGKYARLEELLLKMSSLEGPTNPRRAALLLRAVEQSKEKLTKTQLESVVKLLNQKAAQAGSGRSSGGSNGSQVPARSL